MNIPGLRRFLTGSSDRSQRAHSGSHSGSSSRDAAFERRTKVALRTTMVLASVFASLATIEAMAQIPGLVHYYPGDVDGSDAVGTNPGTLENGATAGTPGRVGGAFFFDGIDDGVNLGDVPDLDYSATSSFTWEAWVKSSGPGTQPFQFVFNANYDCTLSTLGSLAVGDSTSTPENYGGTLRCTTDNRGKTGWFVRWDPADECIVISHPADFTYTFTAGVGCSTDVSKIVNGTVQAPLGAYDVPFQVVATEIP